MDTGTLAASGARALALTVTARVESETVVQSRSLRHGIGSTQRAYRWNGAEVR